jgi:hypothetical protein
MVAEQQHKVTLDTGKGPLKLHVCKDGSIENDEWVKIYDVSFPPEQRQDLAQLKQQLEDGSMELDETRDQDNNILCMTVTEVFQPRSKAPWAFLLACYTAVIPEMRGLGIGSVHRRRLDELLKVEYPTFMGIFSEIESTREAGIDPQLMQTRVRRKSFFMKLGLLPVDIDYRFPSYTPGGSPLHGELLFVPFAASADSMLDRKTLSVVLTRIYTEGYGVSPNDPFIAAVLSSLPPQIKVGQ